MSFFYEKHKDYLYQKAREVCFNSQNVDDLVQTVWERLLGKENVLSTLSHPQQIKYIQSTVVNTNHEMGRKKQLISFSLEDLTLPTDGKIYEIEDQIDLTRKIERFYEAWQHVNPSARDILERKYFLRQTDAEISEALGIKPESVRMYISRAKKHAREGMIAYKSTLL